MIGNTYFKLELLKRNIPFKALCTYKGTRKVKDFQKLSNKEFTSPFSLIVLNNTRNSFQTHFIAKLHWKKLYSQLRKLWCIYIFSVWSKLINFSLSLNPAIYRMANAAKILCPIPDVENKKCLNLILYFIVISVKLL